jgi:hypothetical protein
VKVVDLAGLVDVTDMAQWVDMDQWDKAHQLPRTLLLRHNDIAHHSV